MFYELKKMALLKVLPGKKCKVTFRMKRVVRTGSWSGLAEDTNCH
jgi:hypothetical protein